MSSDLPSIEDLLKKEIPETPEEEPLEQPVVLPSGGPPASAADHTPPPLPTPAPAPAPTAVNDDLEIAHSKTQDALSQKISGLGLAAKEREAAEEAQRLGVDYIDLKGFPISPDALTLIPEDQARALQAISFLFTGPELRLATIDPNNEQVQQLLKTLEERNKSHVKLYKISENSFQEAVKLYANLPKIRKVIKGVQITEEELSNFQKQMGTLQDISNVVKGANVTDILAIVVAASLKMKSSDIHIEAEETDIVVRLRIDGILQDVATIAKDQWKKIINRIKLVAGLKMNVTDRPQDGRFTIFQKNKKIDVRTSTLPTAWGESVVMRILNPDAIELAFEELGFRPNALKKLKQEIEKPHGMIVTTGPTGSGKTTTLYAILKHLNRPGVKIITLEDPVEYKLEGINQSQIDQSKEYTFAKGLRSILRQDPDIVMVGEIRDLETAETAIQASLTGHLLLSTIHTNDAAGAIPRFLSMGVKPFLLAPSVNAIMGQRLARRLCDDCKEAATIEAEQMSKIQTILTAIPESAGETVPDLSTVTFYKAKGCNACNNTGYKGRVGLYEILVKNEEIEKFILSGEISEYAVRDVAAQQGMVNMTQDGLLKAIEGVTSVDEIQRVVGL